MRFGREKTREKYSKAHSFFASIRYNKSKANAIEKGDRAVTVNYQKLPESLAEFQTYIPQALAAPEQVCALFLSALQMYLKNQTEGVAAINLLRGPRPMTPYDVQFLRDRLRGKAYLPLAYFEGATPENGYTPAVPYCLQVLPDPRPQDVEEGYIRVFLKTTGADSPRPMRLRRKGDAWFLWEYSSILSGIRIPAEQDPWA